MLVKFLRHQVFGKVIGPAIGVIAAMSIGFAAPQQAIAAPKFSAISVDARTGRILIAKNADSYRYPASLTKIMTLYLVFEDIKKGKISLNTPLRVSRYARSRPPSKIGFRKGQTILVRHAILALVTKSANDVATAVAENLSGSEAAFARRMTATARRIGMTRTTFRNASGLPNRSQRTTARDMATLGLRMQRDFPRSYRYFSTRRFSYKGRRYGNHNKLLGRVRGVDGIKTGYTRASGFNLTSSVRRGRKRIVAVVMGGRTGGSRNRYMRGLIAKTFKKHRLINSTRIASMAGRPPGYVAPRRKTRVAAVKKRGGLPLILPRIKPASIMALARAVSEEKTVLVAHTPHVQKKPRVLKQQDRLVTAPPKATFKTAAIVDDIPDEIIENDVGAKDVVRKGKTNMLHNGPRKYRRFVKSIASANEIPLPAQQKVVQQAVTQQSQAQQALPKIIHTASTPKTIVTAKRPNLHGKTWNIQIGAFPSKASANGRLEKAVSKARRNLRNKVGFTMEIQKGSAKIYRARFAGFNRSSAHRACRALSRKGIGCFALAPRS